MNLDDSDEKYVIQSLDAVSFNAGRTRDGAQVIVGVPGPAAAAAFFDSRGSFLGTETRTALRSPPGPETPRGKPESNDRLWELVEDWKSELGFTPCTICVSRFADTELGIGIFDLPEYLRDISENQNAEPDEALRQECLAELLDWRRQGRFVLVWGNEYWMNCSGDVTDT